METGTSAFLSAYYTFDDVYQVNHDVRVHTTVWSLSLLFMRNEHVAIKLVQRRKSCPNSIRTKLKPYIGREDHRGCVCTG